MRFRAFISYSHADDAWARWLMRRLETYRVPSRLVGSAGRPRPDRRATGRLLPRPRRTDRRRRPRRDHPRRVGRLRRAGRDLLARGGAVALGQCRDRSVPRRRPRRPRVVLRGRRRARAAPDRRRLLPARAAAPRTPTDAGWNRWPPTRAAKATAASVLSSNWSPACSASATTRWPGARRNGARANSRSWPRRRSPAWRSLWDWPRPPTSRATTRSAGRRRRRTSSASCSATCAGN